MKCHYEVLGLEISCSTDDLKKAYRKLALEWHPDKNLDRLEEAKENFQLIQQAYDILSDPQERAWYDRHRDDILRGGTEQTYKDDSLDVYQYYNTSCYKGYNDDEKGFYTVYRQVFEKITAEDKPFMDDEEDDMEIPQFGYSYSSYEEVHKFYAYWQSYCTAKSFSWEDKFDLLEARRSGVGRQMIRAMEKENKKARDAHKKLRNEEVRELVAFVRKRDKRVQAQKKLMEELKAEKAKKAEELRQKKRLERNKDLENYEESEWNSMSQFENHFNEIESTLDATFGTTDAENNDEVDDIGELYCVACEKDFRSQKAYKNHENSKKHKENVFLLKSLMEEEEEEAVADDASEDLDEITEENVPETEIIVSDEDNVSSEALLGELIKNSTKSKKKKRKGKAHTLQENQEDESETTTNIEVEIENFHIVEDSPVNEDSVPVQNETSSSSKTTSKGSSVKKKGKKDKVIKKEVDIAEKKENEDISEKPITLCGTCNNNFSSRNKLFEHLKQTGHAVYKPENSASCGTGKKNRKKKL